MSIALANIATVLAALFAFAGRAAAESATFGWHATATTATHALQPRMSGPTALNAVPDTKGVFRGEFLSMEGCRLEAIHRLSLDKNGVPQTKKVAFVVPPVEKPTTVTLNGIERTLVFFETEAIAFEPGDCFLLVFKTKGAAADKDTEMCLLQITRIFIPS